MVLAIDVDLLRLPTTPLELLVVILLVSIVAGLVLAGLAAAGTPLVDRKWPADEPLDSTEMLWGESGGYIQRHFKGLDLEVAKDLATGFVEVKVPAGEYIVEQGDPATHFYVLKSGDAEVIQRVQVGDGGLVREDTIRRHSPGDSFGEIGILRRTARTASVRAVTDCVVLQLSAEDFVAGAASSEAEDNPLFRQVDEYMRRDRERQEQAESRRRMGQAPEPPAAAPGQAAPVGAATATALMEPPSMPASTPGPAGGGPDLADTSTDYGGEDAPDFVATHVVPHSGLLAWVAPDAAAEPIATLAGGVELRVVGETGAWARVVAQNGWEGWVDGRALQRR